MLALAMATQGKQDQTLLGSWSLNRHSLLAYGLLTLVIAAWLLQLLSDPTMGDFALFMNAWSQLIRAAAWPALALLVLLRYRPELGRLIDRVRKAFGHEFDPPVQAAPSTTTIAPELAQVRTPAVIDVERIISDLVQNETNKVEALTTLAAKVFLTGQYEQIESSIWGSQLRLLEALNANPSGLPIDDIKRNFYDPAAFAFSETYKDYGFDRWLGFLQVGLLIAGDNQRVTITTRGSDYIVWRLQMHKAPKMYL